MNAEQASKRDVAEADPPGFWGRPLPLDETATASSGSVGVVATVCVEEVIRTSGLMSGRVETEYGTTSEAPADERAGSRLSFRLCQ